MIGIVKIMTGTIKTMKGKIKTMIEMTKEIILIIEIIMAKEIIEVNMGTGKIKVIMITIMNKILKKKMKNIKSSQTN